MKRISPERKASTLAKLLPPYNMTVAAVRRWKEYRKLPFITGVIRLNQREKRYPVQKKQ